MLLCTGIWGILWQSKRATIREKMLLHDGQNQKQWWCLNLRFHVWHPTFQILGILSWIGGDSQSLQLEILKKEVGKPGFKRKGKGNKGMAGSNQPQHSFRNDQENILKKKKGRFMELYPREGAAGRRALTPTGRDWPARRGLGWEPPHVSMTFAGRTSYYMVRWGKGSV